MLRLKTKQHIKFATVDKGDVTLVVAILIETRGSETISVSEPKIVKVIHKTPKLALKSAGVTKSGAFYLPAAVTLSIKTAKSVVSPYLNTFGYSSSVVIPHTSAQPPTK